ncbi:G-protein coupled receptor family C group 6 member A-like [Scyliorhinus canicula]|uniref:G-protein coupled receptor family C group 6 member A-like n=1 Tax=Scyliorhinus canicula TaxID=7830 RepID=UPI0018F6404E|nr:G-protein coupled receptor family C group 6 member A-like [Scyliorhinus canicula]
MFPILVTFTISCWVSFIHAASLCNIPDDIVSARAPGDIIIGGLFPVHRKLEHLENRTQPGRLYCSKFSLSVFLHAQAMIHSIEQINNSTLLPGVILGYEIYDTCSNVLTAIQATTRFISRFNSSDSRIEVHCDYTDYIPNVKAIVGGSYSEISIAVAQLLNLYLIPQISYASSAETLSDKARFGSFLRTVPNDNHQTYAMAKLLENFNWNWVGAIASEDAYGRAALNSFISHAARLNICVDFHELIPIHGNEQRYAKINATAEKIMKSTANVVIVFARRADIIKLFTILIEQNVTKIWIASDSWSNARQVARIKHIEKIGTILGFTFKSGNIPNFNGYLKKLKTHPQDDNKLTKDYIRFINKSGTNEPTWNDSNSKQNKTLTYDQIIESTTYGVYLAIRAIVHALQRVLNCTQRNCDLNFNFPPWQLLNELKSMSFMTGDGKFEFDKSGDSSNGYDIITWKMVNGAIQYVKVGDYNVMNRLISISNNFSNTAKVLFSNCSRTCWPGEMKTALSENTCCFDCDTCAAGYYSEKNNSNKCEKCSEDQWSEVGSSICKNKTVEFLRWRDAISVVLIIFALLGLLIICMIITLFTKYLGTPAVKAAGGWMCYIMLPSLVLGLVSAILFIGEPFNWVCIIRQPLFGISFTLCVSCILVKSFRIILAFSFNPTIHRRLKSAYKPVPIIIVTTGIQVAICSMWLAFNIPKASQNRNIPQIILLSCNEGSYVAFAVMLGYIAFLACVCFIFAFKGRKAPERFNEAKFITFSMLVYLIVWISFAVVYINLEVSNKYFPVTESIAILASIYSILCCHFFPACHIICFKKESNRESNYLSHAREHFKQKGQFVCPVINRKTSSEIATVGQPSMLIDVTADSEFECQANQRSNHTDLIKNDQNQTRESNYLRKRHKSC